MDAAKTFQVAEACRQLGLRAGAVVIRGIDVGDRSPALHHEIIQAVPEIVARFPTAQAVRATPEVAGFQQILRKVGVDPRKYQPSVERLMAFARKRADLPAINSLVDAYNLVSLRSLCSLGAHDLDLIALPVALRMLTGQESFTPLGHAEPEPVTPGEFGYVDAAERVLCRLDVLQADFSKVTKATKNVLLIVEGTIGHRVDLLRESMTAAVDMVVRHCGGNAELIATPG